MQHLADAGCMISPPRANSAKKRDHKTLTSHEPVKNEVDKTQVKVLFIELLPLLLAELLEKPLGVAAVRVGRDGASEHGPVQPDVVRDPIDRGDVLGAHPDRGDLRDDC